MGELLEDHGKLKEAAERYHRAIQAHPDGQAAAEAKDHLERIEKRQPDRRTWHHLRP
jgi:hypothetical protein